MRPKWMDDGLFYMLVFLVIYLGVDLIVAVFGWK